MRKVLAITTFITLALVLFPSAFVNAQSGGQIEAGSVCLKRSTGEIKPINTDPVSVCPQGYERARFTFTQERNSQGLFYVQAFCTYLIEYRTSVPGQNFSEWNIAARGAGLDALGKYSCKFIELGKQDETYTSKGVVFEEFYTQRGAYLFPSLNRILLNSDGNASVGPVTQTTPATPGTSTPGAPTGNQKPVTPGASTTSPTQGNQDCDANFKKVGPLCIPDSPITDPDSIANSGSIGELATNIIRILLYVAGIIAVVFVIIGGYYVMTAGGNDTQAAAGRKTLTNALIGLVIVILAFTIVQAITGFILNG